MIKSFSYKIRTLPTPMAGLALGVSSLGVCYEIAFRFNGWAQIVAALIATGLLTLLFGRYLLHFDTLVADLKHPVLGSIAPTFAMCLMVLSKTLGLCSTTAGAALWSIAVTLHVLILCVFVRHRLSDRRLETMVPSWFIPPVGLIVADVTFPGTALLLPVAQVLLYVGLISYAILLPTMLYRIFFYPSIQTQAQPTIAIMAAPASLCLAGYLTVTTEPNLLIGAILLGIALLMTIAIYFAFWHLLRLQFSPGYAAFTFPMAIGATALYKSAAAIEHFAGAQQYVDTLRFLAHIELAIATLVIGFVFFLYSKNFGSFLAKTE